MENKNLCEWRKFSGCLKTEDFVVPKIPGCIEIEAFDIPVIFRARLNSSGEIEFDFDRICITQDTYFIADYLLPRGTGLSYFSMIGKSDDGIDLEIERIYFSSEHFSEAENELVQLSQGRYSKAKFARSLAKTRQKPLIQMSLTGFNRSHPLTQDCHLGTVSMVECSSVGDSGDISGILQIEAKDEITDISAWHDEASKLLDHVRRVMSFASGLMFRVPIVQFYAGDKLAVDVLSQIRQVSTASFPVFESYSRESIFEVAVNSFFDSPFNVKNLFIAIDWFVMNSSYGEVRLVNAMTVLENLISSNLDENDILIMSDKNEFNKSRKVLRKVLKQCFEKWSATDRESQTLSDINENLANLNRRSLRQKLYILANRWSIPLEDIDEARIKAVIHARNLIVHEGHYNIEHSNSLWDHAMVARELVIRFIFRAIGFEGNYISHLGHYHSAYFPPKTALNK